jgi:hypothetical protein
MQAAHAFSFFFVEAYAGLRMLVFSFLLSLRAEYAYAGCACFFPPPFFFAGLLLADAELKHALTLEHLVHALGADIRASTHSIFL